MVKHNIELKRNSGTDSLNQRKNNFEVRDLLITLLYNKIIKENNIRLNKIINVKIKILYKS